MQEPKAGRRIVSRGEYIQAHIDRAIAIFLGIVLWVFTFIFLLIALVCCLGAVVNMELSSFGEQFTPLMCSLLGIVFGAFGAYHARRAGAVMIKDARHIDPGVPLTRANTADLPANDSLVRASQEPAQAQDGVLLRAASGEEQAGQEGQLLRASVGE